MKPERTDFKTITLRSIFLALIAVIAVTCTLIHSSRTEAASPECGFYVDGTTIRDSKGNPFVIRGINVAHAWYPSETERSIKAVAKTGANAVRVVLSNGSIYNEVSKDCVRDIIGWCKENKLICILEVHDTTGDDYITSLQKATSYWIGMKDILKQEKDHIILNYANEWYGTWNGQQWAEGYKTEIPKLHNAGICNLIMADCAGWGQYPDSIKGYGKSVYDADPDHNVCFSIHMYEYAGGTEDIVVQNIKNALSIGVPVVIGEFSAEHTNGDVAEEKIMSYCEEKQAGYIGWSWKGNNSDLAYLDISCDWDGTSFTPWGEKLVNGPNGIRKTSEICTIYTNSGDDYISVFWGENSAEPWEQAVSVKTKKNGGIFDASNIKPYGYFYVEYSSSSASELILQKWTDPEKWVKVNPYETGYANGHKYSKFSYDDCVTAFGTSNFAGQLDQIHVGATENNITVYSVCYCYSE